MSISCCTPRLQPHWLKLRVTRMDCRRVLHALPSSQTLSVTCWISGCVSWQPQTAAPIHDTQMTLHFQRISLIFRLTSPDKLLAKFTNGKLANNSRGLSPRQDMQS